MKNLWPWVPVADSLLNRYWLEELIQYRQLLVGFSGGLDSTVLLHTLALHPELREKLLAVHINHGLSENALSWQSHCQEFCRKLNLNLSSKAVTFPSQAN